MQNPVERARLDRTHGRLVVLRDYGRLPVGNGHGVIRLAGASDLSLIPPLPLFGFLLTRYAPVCSEWVRRSYLRDYQRN